MSATGSSVRRIRCRSLSTRLFGCPQTSGSGRSSIKSKLITKVFRQQSYRPKGLTRNERRKRISTLRLTNTFSSPSEYADRASLFEVREARSAVRDQARDASEDNEIKNFLTSPLLCPQNNAELQNNYYPINLE